MGVTTKNFQIDLPAGMSTIKLDSKGCATVQYTVKNVSGLVKDGRAVLLSIPQSNPPKGAYENGWIKIDGATDRHFAADQEEVFNVKIAVPPKSAAGSYNFRLDVVDVARTDVGDSARPLQFQVVETAAKPMPKWPIFAALIALVLIGGGVAAWLLTRGVTVPSLAGKTVDEAVQALANSKLTLDQTKIKEEDSSPENSGKIIDQDPKPGAKAGSGQQIEITTGTRMIRMPILTGHTLAEAQAIITQNGLSNSTVTTASSANYAPGVVWAQSPQPGDNTKGGSPVSLKVTPQSVQVPSVVGMMFPQAYQALQRAGLAPGNTSGDINQRVAGQNPAAGAVPVGTQVNLSFACPPGRLCVSLNPLLAQRVYIDRMRIASPVLPIKTR
jgi:beta-lactam-binding protein with PASTA domain